MTMQVLQIDPAQVFVGDRLRAVDAEEAEKLAVSMRERGQLSPIHVGPAMGDGRYPLIAGAHRLAAVFKAGLPFVLAVEFASTDDEARLHEIDENLYRHELTPYDQAAFLAERREIFERLHGAIRRGAKKGSKKTPNLGVFPKLGQLSFWDETTSKFGLPRETLRRAIKRYEQIPDDVWRLLRGMPCAKVGAELDALAQIKNGAVQLAVIKLAKERGCGLRAAIAVVRPARKPANDRDTLQKLIDLWSRSSASSQREFVAFLHRGGELQDVLDETLAARSGS